MPLTDLLTQEQIDNLPNHEHLIEVLEDIMTRLEALENARR